MIKKQMYEAPKIEVLKLTMGSKVLIGSEDVTSGGENMYDD